MLIRNEQKDDAGRISQIHYAAFNGHPMHAPGAEPFEHLIVEYLRAFDALTLSLLAEEDGEAVGHIAISPAIVGKDSEGWFLLGPVGVLPDRQKSGVGSALIREALQLMQEMGAKGIVLVGSPEYYNRFGFKSLSGLTYSGVPDQFVLGLSFTENAPQGEIIAHEAFTRQHSCTKPEREVSESPRGMRHYLSVSRSLRSR
ncbi:GNAT family N-acetyltransferase [Halodesulfovibrio marinisediminis]|uniref:Putative acetyltransferase n=1 Tax=Halodesulfovibrio marinisediminis DSM 17456 TaxID=1121457 RepID=A0A1N6I426_9BACT|nr:N-acetyltransferase [Halodesulfovibrio marinisediminis]SIO26751.1 putative acetyltransferase [Halodesulfovibrio marinisediminis DSM 17456]